MQSPLRAAVLILAAGSIKNKYRSFSFLYNSPALVPVASRSSASFIIDFYNPVTTSIYLVINKEDEALIKKELVYYTWVQLITIEKSEGVSDTLQQALNSITEEDVVVNVVTTIPTDYAELNTVFIDQELSNNEHYSGMAVADGNYTFRFKKEDQKVLLHAFTGIFSAKRYDIEAALGAVDYPTDLLEVVKQLSLIKPLTYQKISWIDTGHEINYADARKKLISSRSFNSISVNNHVGILTKKSHHKQKLAQEVRYVGMLPVSIQILYPRILPGMLQDGEVLMEYYGYPNLSEYQLYRDIEPLQWKRIFDSLQYALGMMTEHTFSIGKDAFLSFYLDKTINRVNEYLESVDRTDALFSRDELVVNGLVCNNFHKMKDAIKRRIDGLYRENDFCIMHGDFCFNNILYDTFSNTVKLIDPRGSFGEHCVGIYGDKKYDLAKLMHSTLGKYDYIVNNLFQYEQDSNTIKYSFPLRSNQQILSNLSNELLKETGAREDDIMFIVGLLFLSMCPLHTDNPNRQKLMYAHGLFFVNKYL